VTAPVPIPRLGRTGDGVPPGRLGALALITNPALGKGLGFPGQVTNLIILITPVLIIITNLIILITPVLIIITLTMSHTDVGLCTPAAQRPPWGQHNPRYLPPLAVLHRDG